MPLARANAEEREDLARLRRRLGVDGGNNVLRQDFEHLDLLLRRRAEALRRTMREGDLFEEGGGRSDDPATEAEEFADESEGRFDEVF